MNKLVTVGQLAKACDVRADTVRYYEKIGMIDEASRTGSGYRKFDEDAAERIRFIKNAQALGFTLEEIRRLIDLAGSCADDCTGIRQFAESKVAELESQIRKMQKLKRELTKLVEECAGEGVGLDDCKILARISSQIDQS